jgi:hypothetical protein
MIKIKTLRYDDEYDFQIRLHFASNECSSSLDIWCGGEDIFKSFAEKLIEFPFGESKTISFKYGEDDDKWAYYLLIKLDVVSPAGEIVIKTIVDNKGDTINHYRCEIPIISEVATINELGKELLKWNPVENETWVFPSE